MSHRDGWIVEYSNKSENSKHIAELVVHQKKSKLRCRNSRRNPPPAPRYSSNHATSSSYNNNRSYYSSHRSVPNYVPGLSSIPPLMYTPIQRPISTAPINGPNFINMYQQMAANQQYIDNSRQIGLMNNMFAANLQQQYKNYMGPLGTPFMPQQQPQFNHFIGSPLIQQQQQLYNKTTNVNDLTYKLQNIQLNNSTERRFTPPHTQQRLPNTNTASNQSRPDPKPTQLDVKLKENSPVKLPTSTSQCNGAVSQPQASNFSTPIRQNVPEFLHRNVDADKESKKSTTETKDLYEVISNSSIDSIPGLTKSKEDLFNQILDKYDSISDESFNGSAMGDRTTQAIPQHESNDYYEAISDDSDAIPDLLDVRLNWIIFRYIRSNLCLPMHTQNDPLFLVDLPEGCIGVGTNILPAQLPDFVKVGTYFKIYVAEVNDFN